MPKAAVLPVPVRGLPEQVDAGQGAGDQQVLDLGGRFELRLGQPA